jgi:hypothetical protein
VGLVLDEPTERDKVEEVGGLKFLLDGDVATRLENYLPLQVDYDDRFWMGFRIRTSRRTAC